MNDTVVVNLLSGLIGSVVGALLTAGVTWFVWAGQKKEQRELLKETFTENRRAAAAERRRDHRLQGLAAAKDSLLGEAMRARLDQLREVERAWATYATDRGCVAAADQHLPRGEAALDAVAALLSELGRRLGHLPDIAEKVRLPDLLVSNLRQRLGGLRRYLTPLGSIPLAVRGGEVAGLENGLRDAADNLIQWHRETVAWINAESSRVLTQATDE